MTDVVAIAFTPAPTSDSPNLRGGSNAGALATFHRLIELCFASVRRWNPDLELALVTTTPPGKSLEERLRRHRVEILATNFEHRPPDGFYGSFNASLFSLDAMAALAHRYAVGARIALIDPDVVCSGPLTPVFDRIPVSGFLAYDAGYPVDYDVHGLSRRTAAQLHVELGPELDDQIAVHYGGELYGFTVQGWKNIADRVDEAWSFSLERWRSGETKFVTEEHILSYALRYVDVVSAHGLIRRIWTAPTRRTVQRDDLQLPLWHLPAEKHRGLKTLHEQSMQAGSWFWTDDSGTWRKHAGRICGLGPRQPARWVRDSVGGQVRGAQRAIRSLTARRFADQAT